MRKITAFLFWPVLAGVLAAAGLVYLFPELIRTEPASVEIRQVDPSAPPPTGLMGPVSYSGAVQKAAPAVVNIYTRTVIEENRHPMLDSPWFREFFNLEALPKRERIQSSLGSGVIFSPQGHVLTNNHVIEGADTIIVALNDGRESQAEVIGTDPDTDLAVLRIELENLPSITLSPSSRIAVGDVVLAIGNPFGVGQTVTQGIISATGRSQLGLSTFENFIQTDAAINPGNSGGALVDAYGNLVGINTAIFSRSGGSQGIGFAIPSDLAGQIMAQIIENGRVVRGWLGIEIQEMTPQLAESFGMQHSVGLIIAGIYRNSPAHQAGLQPGDILLGIEGKPITGPQDALNQITQTPPGQELRLTVTRNGQTREVLVRIGQRPPSQG